MQLRRGPPDDHVLDLKQPALRLVKAPQGAKSTPRRWRGLQSFDGDFLRVVAGLLLVFIPTSILLGFVMANFSSQTAIDQTKARAEATAASAAVRITDWFAERKAELRTIAQGNVDQLSKPDVNARLLASTQFHPSFDEIQVSNRNGRVVASTAPDEVLTTPSGLTFADSLTVETIGTVKLNGTNGLQLIITAPIVGTDGKAQGVVAGNLFLVVLGRLLNPYGLDTPTLQDQEVHLINARHLLLYSSDWGVLPSESQMLAHGTLKVEAEGAIYDHAIRFGSGAAEIVDY
jgi:hypothetical protein